jgi:diacylglycerol kinase family enzyme
METAKNLNLNINKFTLGMVGVGSSNDYLKNGREQYDAALDFAKACSTHIAKMTWGQDNSCYFAASASLGLTAETNHYFNHRPLWLRKLAQIHTDLGVAVAALVTLITHTPQILNVKTIDGIQKLTITNGGIVLKRSFGGAFAYSRDPTPGMLGCYFCNGLTRKQTLITMADLLKGRFPSSSKHLKMEASTLQLTADQPFMIECDGETYLVNEVTIETTQGPKICPLIKF